MLKNSRLLINIFMSLFMAFGFITGTFAFDNNLTVTFRKDLPPDFLKTVTLLTDTKVIEQENNTYKLEIQTIVNRASLDKYAELFSLMPMVQDIVPLPRQKMADRINSTYYNTLAPTKEPESASSGQPELPLNSVYREGVAKTVSIAPSRDIYVSLRPFDNQKEEKDFIEQFNLIFGTKIVQKKGFYGYILRLPLHSNPQVAARTFGLCPYVLNVSLSY